MLFLALVAAPPLFTDPLGPLRINAARVCTADLNADDKPDFILRAREDGGGG